MNNPLQEYLEEVNSKIQGSIKAFESRLEEVNIHPLYEDMVVAEVKSLYDSAEEISYHFTKAINSTEALKKFISHHNERGY